MLRTASAFSATLLQLPVASRNPARRWLWCAPLLILGAGIAPQPAHADLFADNEARRAIIDLRQRYLALSEENNKLRESLQTTQNQLDSLRSDVARIRNREEQLARELAELRRAAAANAHGEDKNSQTGSTTTGSTTETSSRPEDAAGEKAAFDAALGKFRSSDYAAAQAGLRAYLQKYPQGTRRIAALYWLGNSDYALRNYKSAMRNYRAVVAQAPNHERAPEALLALSACQVELQDMAGARSTLEQLIKTYPRSEAAQAAQDRLSRLR